MSDQCGMESAEQLAIGLIMASRSVCWLDANAVTCTLCVSGCLGLVHRIRLLQLACLHVSHCGSITNRASADEMRAWHDNAHFIKDYINMKIALAV